MKYLLGIDVGTTGTKTLLFSENGQLLGHAYRSYASANPRVGWSEQNAEDWWNAVVQTVQEACQNSEIRQNVAAISLSLQGATMVAVDTIGNQIRPAMVWNDTRCSAQQAAFRKEVGNDWTMYQKTGWHLCDGGNAMQIRWMKENEPDLFKKTAMFLSVPDYISMRMTGVPALDLSNAGINQLADIQTEAYDERLLAFVGIPEEKLGKIVHSGDVIGHLTPEAAEALGLSTQTLLVAGAHDQYAVALGAGACKAGDVLIGSGTCWVVTAIRDHPDFRSGLSQSVAAIPGKWGSLWSLSSGGICLDWLRRNVMASNHSDTMDYATLNREAAHCRAAEDGLYFIPFSSRSASGKQFQKGTFLGLDLSHNGFHLARAIMEGVVFQILWMIETFGIPLSDEGITLAGGASRSALWCQLLADISGLPVKIPEVADLACVGAAILAGVGCGIFKDAEEGYKRMAVRERVLLPDPERTKLYAPLKENYQRQAEALAAAYQL